MTPEQKQQVESEAERIYPKGQNLSQHSQECFIAGAQYRETMEGVQPVWIKAIDRLPGIYKEVKWRHPIVEIGENIQWVEVVLEMYAHCKNDLEWLDEQATHDSEVKRLRGALEKIAAQKTTNEMDEEDKDSADYEFAYNHIIQLATEALNQQP